MLVTLFPISTLVKPLQYEKRFLPDARNAVRDRDARQATATPVFVNRIISITCTLNDRKVIA